MTQQLWYTWSADGYGSAHGARVRAATSDLTRVEGPRVRSFIPLLNYTLPDATDLYLPPSQAPLCLAFLKASSTQEMVLIQKTYLGLDYIRRPGNYFSHLLAELPPVSSSTPTGQLPFSAREAISFWRAPLLWRSAEGDWPAGELKLNPITPDDLFSQRYSGPLNEQNVVEITSVFQRVFSAFITLAHHAEGKRLYLVGQPDIVATLIWGITRALPRTLPIMQNLTFSTFEANVETDAKPLIVGTCWQPNYLKKGSEEAELNLPSTYYQPNNPSGITIHCTTLEATPFTIPTNITPLLSEYLQFVLDCFASGPAGLNLLHSFLTSAEKRAISDLPDLFHHFVEHHKPLTDEDVTRILQRLYHKASTSIQQTETILQQETLSPALTSYAQLGNIQAEVEDFIRENVQSSLFSLLLKQPDWWTNQGEKFIYNLYQLSSHPSSEQRAQSGQRFIQRIQNSKQWQKQQRADLLSSLTPFAQGQNSEPGDLLVAFTNLVEQQQLYIQQDLKKALLPLGIALIDQLGQVIRSDRNKDLTFWQRTLSLYLNNPSVWPEIWIHLLKTLSVSMRFNATYQIWWQSGKQYIRTLRAQAQKLVLPNLDSALSSFASSVAQDLLQTLQSPTSTVPALSFWSEFFQTIAPPSGESMAWAAFLNQLSGLSFTPNYQQWYKDYGHKALNELLPLSDQQKASPLAQSLNTFRSSASDSLLAAIRADQNEPIALFNSLLLQIAPAESTPALWLNLLFELRSIPINPGFVSWWNLTGQQTTLTLRRLAEKKSIAPEHQLLPFAQNAATLLFNALKEEISLNQHKYDTTISYLLKLLATTIPAGDAQIWPALLIQLSQSNFYLRIRWDLRAELLTHWKNIIVLTRPEAQAQISLWLKVSWPELDPLLSLNLPESWHRIAIASALETYQSASSDLVIATASHHYNLFEEHLQLLLPTSQQNVGLNFFAFLAQHGYERILPLLDSLLSACNYQLEISEHLLQSAHITSDQAIIILLEEHCQILLSSHELPPTLLQLLDRYLAIFDLDRLDKPPTQKLFQRLQQRELHGALRLSDSVRQAIEGWYTIVSFLSQQGDATTLRTFLLKLRTMTRLESTAQKKLAIKLVPALVRVITTESELTRVLDTLGQGQELELLQQMAKTASEFFGKTDIPIRIALYVRMILTEAENSPLLPDEKDLFVEQSFQLLFKDIAEPIRKKYFPEPLWYGSLVEAWERARHFSGMLISLKNAIHVTASVPDIASLYQPAFETLLEEEEREAIALARRFVAEYEARNDPAMLQAYENLKRLYNKSPRYTKDQIQRIQAALQKLSPSIPNQSPMIPNRSSLNTGKPGYLNNSGFSQNPGLTIGNPSSWSTLPAQSSPARTDQPMQTPPTNLQVIAEVLGNKILLETFEITVEVKKAYLLIQVDRKDEKIRQTLNGSSEKKILQKERDDIKKLLDNEKRLRKTSLHALVNDILVQQELQRLGNKPQNGELLQKFTAYIEQEVLSTLEDLKVTFPRHSILNFQDIHAVEKIKQALRVFIREEAFEISYLKESSHIKAKTVEEWAKDDRDAAKIDYKLAENSKSRSLS